MLVPLLLLFLATLSAAVVAYGTHPGWAQHPWGYSLILFSRVAQWPLIVLAIVLCLAVVGLVVAGRRRAWWLIGLAPILALFVHRFATDPLRAFRIADGPNFRDADKASFVADEDYVVGLTIGGDAYAYPAYLLYPYPVVLHPDHDKRVLLVWSAFANRAVAWTLADRGIAARDLEVVSMPANALLLYNRKYGQFVNGVTGLTPRGERPTGFGPPLDVRKTTWGQWRTLHPKTKVMAPSMVGTEKLPNRPLDPWFPMPPAAGAPGPDARVILFGTTPPAALAPDAVADKPLNLMAGSAPLLVLRDPATGRIRAFERRVDGDLTPKFSINSRAPRKPGLLVDADTNTAWNADGRALDGELGRAGKRLAPIPVDEDLPFAVLKTWMPDLILLEAR